MYLSVMLQILGYFVQGLICLIYMPLCFQLARFTAEAASRVYADLTKDIDAGEVPDIAHADVPAVATLFYNLPVRGSRCACTRHQSCCFSIIFWDGTCSMGNAPVSNCFYGMLAGECHHEDGLSMY